MKVKELIAKLQEYNGELEVLIFDELREEEPLKVISVIEPDLAGYSIIISAH